MEKKSQDFKEVVKEIETTPGKIELRELQKARMYIHFVSGKGKVKSESPTIGEPIICEIYHYATSNQQIKNAIFQDLKSDFKLDLIALYDQYRKEFDEVPGVKVKLNQMIKELERPEFAPTHKRFDVKRFFQALPTNMRKRLLSKLVSVEFRELYGKAAEKFRSSYLMTSFYMMENHYPYVNTLPKKLTPELFGEDKVLTFDEYKDSFVSGMRWDASEQKAVVDKKSTMNKYQTIGEDYKVENMRNSEYSIKIMSEEDSTDSLYQQIFSQINKDTLALKGEAQKFESSNPFPLFYFNNKPFTIHNLLDRKSVKPSAGLQIDATNPDLKSNTKGLEGENESRGMAYKPENFDAAIKREEEIEQKRKKPSGEKKEGPLPFQEEFLKSLEKFEKDSSRDRRLLTEAIMSQFSQLANPWVDAQGKTYPSEQELLRAKELQWMPSIEEEIVLDVVQMLENEMKSIEAPIIEAPEPVTEEVPAAEVEAPQEEQLPLAAHNMIKLKKIAKDLEDNIILFPNDEGIDKAVQELQELLDRKKGFKGN